MVLLAVRTVGLAGHAASAAPADQNTGEQVHRVLVGRSAVSYTHLFLTKLAGVSDPETKRKLIGGEFVYCFADEEIGRAHV